MFDVVWSGSLIALELLINDSKPSVSKYYDPETHLGIISLEQQVK